jgi:hypothetical protein
VEPRFPFSLTNGHISLNASRAVTDVRILYTSDDNGDPSVSTYLLPAIPKIDQNGTVCLSAVNFSSSAVLDQADGARPAVGSNFTIYPQYKVSQSMRGGVQSLPADVSAGFYAKACECRGP